MEALHDQRLFIRAHPIMKHIVNAFLPDAVCVYVMCGCVFVVFSFWGFLVCFFFFC